MSTDANDFQAQLTQRLMQEQERRQTEEKQEEGELQLGDDFLDALANEAYGLEEAYDLENNVAATAEPEQ